MRKVKRWRYYCDFCKKAGGSGGHMQSHENGCTLNPKRHCGMCNLIGNPQEPIEKLIGIVKKHLRLEIKDCPHSGLESWDVIGDCKEMLKELENLTDNCPACTMAAIRQAGIPVPATGFDYKDARKEYWNAHNEAIADYGGY